MLPVFGLGQHAHAEIEREAEPGEATQPTIGDPTPEQPTVEPAPVTLEEEAGFEATEDCVTGFSAVHAPEGKAGKWIGLGVGAAVDVLTLALLAAVGPTFGPR